MKQPKKNHSLYLTLDVREQAIKQANKEDRTFNSLVVRAIKEYLERNK